MGDLEKNPNFDDFLIVTFDFLKNKMRNTLENNILDKIWVENIRISNWQHQLNYLIAGRQIFTRQNIQNRHSKKLPDFK